jgi:hypothetical protein
VCEHAIIGYVVQPQNAASKSKPLLLNVHASCQLLLQQAIEVNIATVRELQRQRWKHKCRGRTKEGRGIQHQQPAHEYVTRCEYTRHLPLVSFSSGTGPLSCQLYPEGWGISLARCEGICEPVVTVQQNLLHRFRPIGSRHRELCTPCCLKQPHQVIHVRGGVSAQRSPSSSILRYMHDQADLHRWRHC